MEAKKVPTAGPWATRSEFLVDQALQANLSMTPEQLRVMRPVAAPQQLNPKRDGFAQNQPTINDVLNVDRYTPTYRSWVSGIITQPSAISDYNGGGGYNGSARNAMTEGVF